MLNELHNQAMPGKKAMVVISNGKSMKETGTLYQVLKELAQAKVEMAVFDLVQANPLRSTVMDGAAFAKEHGCDERFIAMAKALGKADASCAQDFVDALVKLQKDCGVDGLKMSDFGIQKSELKTLAKNARETMGGLFGADPKEVSHDDCVAIFEKAYK